MAGQTPAALSNLERGLLLWKNANTAYINILRQAEALGSETSIEFVMAIEVLLAVINGVMPLKIATTGKSYKTRMTDKSVKNRKHGRGN